MIGLSVIDVLKQLLSLQFKFIKFYNKDPTNNSLVSQLIQNYTNCIASLATHVYYHDQISDMVDELFSKLLDFSKKSNENLVNFENFSLPITNLNNLTVKSRKRAISYASNFPANSNASYSHLLSSQNLINNNNNNNNSPVSNSTSNSNSNSIRKSPKEDSSSDVQNILDPNIDSPSFTNSNQNSNAQYDIQKIKNYIIILLNNIDSVFQKCSNNKSSSSIQRSLVPIDLFNESLPLLSYYSNSLTIYENLSIQLKYSNLLLVYIENELFDDDDLLIPNYRQLISNVNNPLINIFWSIDQFFKILPNFENETNFKIDSIKNIKDQNALIMNFIKIINHLISIFGINAISNGIAFFFDWQFTLDYITNKNQSDILSSDPSIFEEIKDSVAYLFLLFSVKYLIDYDSKQAGKLNKINSNKKNNGNTTNSNKGTIKSNRSSYRLPMNSCLKDILIRIKYRVENNYWYQSIKLTDKVLDADTLSQLENISTDNLQHLNYDKKDFDSYLKILSSETPSHWIDPMIELSFYKNQRYNLVHHVKSQIINGTKYNGSVASFSNQLDINSNGFNNTFTGNATIKSSDNLNGYGNLNNLNNFNNSINNLNLNREPIRLQPPVSGIGNDTLSLNSFALSLNKSGLLRSPSKAISLNMSKQNKVDSPNVKDLRQSIISTTSMLNRKYKNNRNSKNLNGTIRNNDNNNNKIPDVSDFLSKLNIDKIEQNRLVI
ncbi:uncharacterized protein ASCRUDRAFT_68572 [Ascoidea rubescens DSM 1968]|uniref:Uncharacterized protein n=1 Tax=Ascoidea rubescens DSM 1968 TaxID=1344418 RepID=A0A1D2VME9_9ASCO|nr:hypothetical protein ASCRUDRAFT_68572 [Ascoidea rubescens DSM 1968]ODV62737.1 hypothetical protein ASCRUDRAFT_68572 [Ascoidea rubescens DSM 1968]